jgi:hypothetical protein
MWGITCLTEGRLTSQLELSYDVSYVREQHEGFQLKQYQMLVSKWMYLGKNFSAPGTIFLDKINQFNIWMFGRIHIQVCYIHSKLSCPVRGFLLPSPKFMANMQMLSPLPALFTSM